MSKLTLFTAMAVFQVIMMRDWQGQNVLVDVSRGQQVQPQNIGMYMAPSQVPGYARQKKPTKKKPTLRLGHCERPSLSKGGTRKLRLSK